MARMMLNSKKLSKRLWAEALNIAYYTINRVYLRPSTKKTHCELWKDKKPDLDYFHIFGSMCFILNDCKHLSKYDSKSDESVFLDYSNNMRTQNIVESANVVIDDYQDYADYLIVEEITNLLETPNVVPTAPEVRVIEEGQSSEPSLKEK